LREVFVSTLWFRAAAGGYCAAAIISGGLELRWAAVTVTDFSLVAVQIWLLRREGWRDE
jgi:Na+-driven multidrug efflux pump